MGNHLKITLEAEEAPKGAKEEVVVLYTMSLSTLIIGLHLYIERANIMEEMIDTLYNILNKDPHVALIITLGATVGIPHQGALTHTRVIMVMVIIGGITTITQSTNQRVNNDNFFSNGGSQPKKKYRAKRGTRGGRSTRSKKKVGLTNTGLFNLSTATFSHEDKVVLNHGLKFVPPLPLNKFKNLYGYP